MRIRKEDSVVLIIDFQEKLFPHIYNHISLKDNVTRLVSGLTILNIPTIITEQYRKGLGNTIQPLKEILPDVELFEKITFSCCDDSKVLATLQKLNRKFVIITGIEAHVCVLQTVIDLIDYGFMPVVVADCISSRKETDKLIALERIKNEGAIITSYESILFELCRVAGNEKFKEISAIIK
jgi:nicotinamidase-related amidase